MPRKDKSMFYASYLLSYSNNKMSHQEQVCKHQNHGKPAISTIKYMKSVRKILKEYLSFRICVIIHNTNSAFDLYSKHEELIDCCKTSSKQQFRYIYDESKLRNRTSCRCKCGTGMVQ